MYDAVVVGASLAGAATSIHLANAGLRVVIVERNRELPAHKACGEGLFPTGVRELQRLGLGDELAEMSVPLSGVRFHAGEAVARASFGSPGAEPHGVMRERLDRLVLDRARSVGVEVLAGTAARGLAIAAGGRAAGVRTRDDEILGRVVVGADGLHSAVRKAAGLTTPARGARYGLSLHVTTPTPVGDWVDVYFGTDHELYLTPVGPCSLNVALLARRPFFTTFSGDRDARLREFLGAHPALPPGWQAASRARGAGPFPVRARRLSRSNVVLVGDAAGFFDGITGEGMSLALVSARLCAEAVRQHLAGGDLRPFREYATKYAAAARNSEALGRLSLALAGRPRLARFAVRNLGRRPATFDRLAAINAGELPFSAIRPRDIAAIALGL